MILATAILSACGSNGDQENKDLDSLKNKKSELSDKQTKLYEEIKKIEAEIDKIDPDRRLDLVTTEIAIQEKFEHFLEIQGNVETKQNVLIYPETSGLLEEVYVSKGQRVKKGELLAKIDDGGFLEQISQAEIERDLAKTTYERQASLWKQKIGSEIQFLQAKTNYEAQDKVLQQLKETYAKTLIKAPFNGIIDDIIREKGTIVTPGPNSEIFRIVCLEDMYVKAEVPENNLPNIKVGTLVDIYIPVLDKKIKSKVRQLSHHINSENRTFSIEIRIPNEEGLIKPNLTARLRINDYTSNQAILVQKNAISNDSEDMKKVYLIEKVNGKTLAKKQRVETGKSTLDRVEIIKGLTPGDQVIIDGARKVKHGQEVRIISDRHE
jgi:RND family efflux transporter MFP subunit